ncbi:MAG: 50S ribosomal protein L10 [Ignavibacteriaceae bacterium]|nr:50S ribosomal protein L10 [Ignavibacteriaceae bacterium]
MDRNEKSEIISEIKELLESSSAVYLTDYHGINVEDISSLRTQFRNEGVQYRVFKNTLMKRALKESGKYEKIADQLIGMTGFAFTTKILSHQQKSSTNILVIKKNLLLKPAMLRVSISTEVS